MEPTPAVHLDGRKLRAQRSRAAVAVAALELIREGNMKPTASDIANRADVSLRLVFHHFEDMEALFRAVFRLQNERLRPLLAQGVTCDTPVAQRVVDFVEDRAHYLEEVAQVYRATQLFAPSAPSLEEHLQASRAVLRNQVASLFSGELRRFPVTERKERLLGMQAATSFASWETLRVDMDLEVGLAKAVMRRELRAQLGLSGR
jgi:AcrR family transcriptional regulator